MRDLISAGGRLALRKKRWAPRATADVAVLPTALAGEQQPVDGPPTARTFEQEVARVVVAFADQERVELRVGLSPGSG